MRRSLFAVFSWFMAPAAFAILDTNNNGLSDFWERDFNNGTLFDEFFDPQADSDADGWTNVQEAAAGTSPFDANSPDGMVGPQITHISEVPEVTPEAVTITWQTLAGKQYTLLFSPDLTEGSWLPVGDPFVANGGETTYGFAISQADKCFWRVSVEDIDTDSDGLNNHEEHLAGSDPTLTDSDGDTLSDHAELIAGTDPLQADADGDGWPDPQELAAGTDSRNQDTDDDGIPDSIDSDPLASALAFADTDGDGIPDGDDAAPNDPRGPAPSIASETASGNPLSNLIKDEIVKFILTVSNLGGPAPTASNLTFYLNGAEENATITAVGAPVGSSQRFLLTWAAKTTANYPTITLQNLSLRFRDSQQATSWLKLARIDVAEWEGMIASLRSGAAAELPSLQVFSHFGGKKSISSYGMVPYRSKAGWYRGPRDISFVNDSSGSTLLTTQIQGTIRYPLFLISASSQGLPVLDKTISISDAATFTHSGYLIVNDCNTDIRMELTPGGTATISSGNQGYLARPEPDQEQPFIASRKMHYKKNGNWVLFQEGVISLNSAIGSTRNYITGRFYPSTATEGFSHVWMDFLADVEAHIKPHAAGTFEYPGLPIPCEFHTGTTHPTLLPIGHGAWHKIILKAGPDAAALSNGIGLWLRKGENGDAAPQTGFTLKVLGENEVLEDLDVPAAGKITFAANSPEWQRLTSPEGLMLFISRDENVDGIHDLSLQLLKKQEWYAQGAVRIASIDLIPVELGVDNNRDGDLVLGSTDDQTTAAKPYRFWLNNDHDNYGQPDTYNAADDHPWTTKTPDNTGEKIESERDVEDFARLHLKIEGIRPALETGTMTLGFKWKSVQAGTPKIRLFKAADTDGGTKYLSNMAKAADQVSLGASALGIVEGTAILDLPVSYWTSTASSPTKFFLYEGLGEGKGELSIVIKKGNTVIGEGGSVFLDILDIRKMYEQWSINPLAVIPDPDRDVLLPITGVTAVHDPTAGHTFQPAWDENLTDKNYVICVHGWRKGGPAAANAADFYKGRSDEITMFKRLWHRGFKGRYIGFIWPTYDVTVTSVIPGYGDLQSALQSKFDYSEYRAWKCGEAFKIMVNGLPSGYKKKVFAHSLGNVVVASALEKGMTVDNYALLNAAISARCYHKAAPTPINNSKDDLSDDATAAVRALSYRGDSATVGHARLENVGGKLSNFYLPNDRALSGAGGWEDGQYLKPIKEYEYDNSSSSSVYWDSSGWTNRIVVDPHEAMAMANTSHSKAVGSAPVLAGAGGTGIDTNIDMNGPGMLFGIEHEAVFKWRCSRTWEFYSKLWDELDLPGTKAP